MSLAVSLLWLTACSVREDRVGCPVTCVLNLSSMDVGKFLEEGCDCFLWRAFSFDSQADAGAVVARDILSEGIVALSDMPDTLVLELGSASEIWLSFAVAPLVLASMDRMTIPFGSEAPPLYSSCERYYASSGDMEVSPQLHKNFASVHLTVQGAEKTDKMSLEGNVAGYDLLQWNPEPGAFTCSLKGSSGSYEARIPRQTDDSLMLVISTSDGLVRKFPLGQYIFRSGYDWSSKDLEDLDVVIEYSKTSALIQVNLWHTTLSFTIIF